MPRSIDLYTLVSYDSNSMTDFECVINESITRCGFDPSCVITSHNVLEANSKLNSGKGDGNGGLANDQFKRGGADFVIHVSFLFCSLLNHRVLPKNITLSSIIPKVKTVIKWTLIW